MSGIQTSELQVLILLIAEKEQGRAYGYAIRTILKDHIYLNVSIAEIHKAIGMLENLGLVKTFYASGNSVRGGRRKRVLDITNLGIRHLSHTKKHTNSLRRKVLEGLDIQSLRPFEFTLRYNFFNYKFYKI